MHLFSRLVTSSFLLLNLSSIYAQNIDHMKYVSAFAKNIQYVEANQSEVWPKFHLTKYPIILSFIYRHPAYAFHFTPKDPAWQNINVENMSVFYHPKIIFPTNIITSFMMIEDQLTLLQLLPPADDLIEDEIFYLLRYLFNDYQKKDSNFSQEALDYLAYNYNGFNDIDNVALANIERAILKDYLVKNNPEHLKNYLAIHNIRISLLDKDSAQYEKALELSAGTGNYAAAKSLGLKDQMYVKFALTSYPSGYASCASLTTKYDIKDCLTKSHYNFVDLALGYALDNTIHSEWKKSVAEVKNTNFTEILNDYYPMSNIEREVRVNANKLHYEYDKLIATLNATLKEYLTNMQEARDAYNKISGFEVNTDITSCHSLEPSHYEKRYDINSTTTLITNYTARYLCDGDHYRMNITFDTTPFVFSESHHNKDHSTTDISAFKVTPETLLTIDDKQETVGSFIKAHKKTSFHQLLINNNQVMVRISGLEGNLDGTEEKLIVTLSQTNLNKKFIEEVVQK